MAGATEKIIIQIASRLNVNVISFIFLFSLVALPKDRACDTTNVHWLFLTMAIIL